MAKMTFSYLFSTSCDQHRTYGEGIPHITADSLDLTSVVVAAAAVKALVVILFYLKVSRLSVVVSPGGELYAVGVVIGALFVIGAAVNLREDKQKVFFLFQGKLSH